MSLIFRYFWQFFWAFPCLAWANNAQFFARADLESSDPWQAAAYYCVQARQGNIEAQYRLGVLYAFGLGVPENRPAAASLFSIAAEQGHHQAQDMLDTIRISQNQLPACVLSAVLPEKAPVVAGSILRITFKGEQQRTARIITQIARWHGVDPNFALSIAVVESRLQTFAVSPKSAMGVMQLIPDTAARFNVQDAFNVSQNVKGGVRYLRLLLDRYQGRIDLVSAAYNAGEGAVDKYRGIPPYRETQQYVSKIQKLYPAPIHLPDVERFSQMGSKHWQ
ncbi:lytic transglycosylase domain-containing protein [Chitinibacter fontanus]|uniref:Lytic transglycosylase domain-containing protein n=1 Tax=Chitinibacter fontanus TaxID=1737446 RepID=A0A7D5V8N2_9NEIS|nr:lytic transglycosylase domain-containing protein [Chitinibacter fontanus]QLI80572.1 lytic transglycosylase domain-containing protein [Chitinibacter fontanus]